MARRYLPAAALAFIAVASGSHCLAEDTATTPLYERLGGATKMTAVVGETLDKMASSPRTRATFDKVDMSQVKEKLVAQICSLTGGGCTYEGATMQDVHDGQGITSAEFYQLVETLRNTMRNYDIPLSARNELLAALAPAKPAS